MLFAPSTFHARVFIHGHALRTPIGTGPGGGQYVVSASVQAFGDGQIFPLTGSHPPPAARISLRMKPWLRPLFLTFLFIGGSLPARAADPAPSSGGAAVRELRIEPGTTGVPLGKARLSVEPLVRVPGKEGLTAAYKVDVTPFTSKSEAGRFSVAISDADLSRLAGGETVRFSGEAVSQDGSNTSVVQGRADPATGGGDHGALRIQVDGKKGKLVFHTSYHLAR